MNFDKMTAEDIRKMVKGEHSSQNKIQVTVGNEYNPTVTRKVGDTWTDSEGILWEQKEGYTARVESEWRKEVREQLNSFPNCSKETCTCITPNRLDNKMRVSHGMCFDCVIEMEHKLRLQGKFKEYENERLKQNALAWLNEAESDKNMIADTLSRLEFTNEFGDVEKWDTKLNKEELLVKITQEFEQFKKEFLEKLESKDVE